jgi:hypothetical protein
MIDGHCGYLARDGRGQAIKLRDALNPPEFDRWTLRRRRNRKTASRPITTARRAG